jgi:hypothetical protein
MNRLVPVVLVLLILSTGFGLSTLYEYTLNQQKTTENALLKQELSDAAQKLEQAQNKLDETRNQVTQEEGQIVSLQMQLVELQANITRLQRQLRARGETTVALSFMWSPSLAVDARYLRQVVNFMDDQIWDPTGIFFFVYSASQESFIPSTANCSSPSGWGWHDSAIKIYPVKDIPVAIVSSLGWLNGPYFVGPIEGCACLAGTNCWMGNGVVAFALERYLNPPSNDARVLTLELFHVIGGISDQEIYAIPNSTSVIPVAWYPRLQAGAKQYETPIPADYPF